MEVEGMHLEDSNVGPEEAGDTLNVEDMLKLVGKLEDKQQQPVGNIAVVGDTLLNSEDRKDTEVLVDSLSEGSLLEGSSPEDMKLLVEVLNMEKLKVH